MKKNTTTLKEYSILQKYPAKTLNNTTVNTLANTEAPIEVFPPEIFFKGKHIKLLTQFPLIQISHRY